MRELVFSSRVRHLQLEATCQAMACAACTVSTIDTATYSRSPSMTTSRFAVLVALALLRTVTANDQPRFEVVGSGLKTRGEGTDC